MKTSFAINAKEITWKWPVVVLLACILLLNSGCQSTHIPFVSSSTPPLSVHIPLPTSTATSLPPAIRRKPSDTPTSIPFPTSIIFPLPLAVPIEAFQSPVVENMETHELYGGAWTTYTPPDWPKQFQQTGETPSITSIAAAPDGTLWFSTTGGVASIGVGVYHYDGKTWTHYSMAHGAPFNEFYSIAVAPDGAIWFGSFCCGVSRFDGKSWTVYTTENGLAGNDIRSVIFAPDGALWVGTEDKGASRFDGKGWQYYTSQNGLWGNYVAPIFVLPDNTLLFSSTNDSYGTAKLIHFDGQRWVNYPTPWTDEGKYTVEMAAAPNGDFWFATEFSGVYRLSGNTWTNYTTRDGLASNEIHSVVVTRDGSIWFGTTGGVSWFDGEKWMTFKLEGDSGNNWTGPIAAASDGSMWLAYFGGIAHYVPPKNP